MPGRSWTAAPTLDAAQGEGLTEVDLEEIIAGIKDLDDALEIEARNGGQPLYPLQMVAEWTTAVVTDSTTSLAPGVLERPDVRVVPLTFHFGEDETYTDKVDMTNEEFYDRLRDSDVFPTTAQPSPGAFVEAYEALSDYDDILVLTLSSKFSGTYDWPCRRRGWWTVLSTCSTPRAPRWGRV